ncbi:hypothetical protein NUW54_g11945 [Trametes sanguinea]|uniref:Uncharacterized protein n=1 Tax=Trametes sanguinea TaxID=158606 RepID=A0ACC1N4C4_9APHY|nr:hypothetical protein NUW54_g11945 [Trametes sanguinea]
MQPEHRTTELLTPTIPPCKPIVQVESAESAPAQSSPPESDTGPAEDELSALWERLQSNESLLMHITENNEGVDLIKELKGRYSEDPFYKVIMDQPCHYKNFSCEDGKPNNQRLYGLLNPLKVPHAPWKVIGIGFVGPLPESKNWNSSYDSITVIIDLLTGKVHLVPSRTNYTARQVAELVFEEVYKHHSMPKAIVSDWDSLITSTFWTHLHQLVGVELQKSSVYHPESDSYTERANCTVTQMLRQCVGPSQRDWVAKLPAIEFAVNIA